MLSRGGPGPPRRRVSLLRRWRTAVRRRVLPSATFHFIGLTILTGAITVATVGYDDWVPVSAFDSSSYTFRSIL